MRPLKGWCQARQLLAGLVQKKEVTPVEIVVAAMARLERLNPKINAVIHKMYDKAKAAA
ncbi:MAG TPA: amidase, partial [Bacillota bacterium]|nr:amidase [Bacillota bacterium]